VSACVTTKRVYIVNNNYFKPTCFFSIFYMNYIYILDRQAYTVRKKVK